MHLVCVFPVKARIGIVLPTCLSSNCAAKCVQAKAKVSFVAVSQCGLFRHLNVVAQSEATLTLPGVTKDLRLCTDQAIAHNFR